MWNLPRKAMRSDLQHRQNDEPLTHEPELIAGKMPNEMNIT